MKPKPIELTAPEFALYARISEDNSQDAAELMASLLEREAIPRARMLIFADPAYAETGKSPLEVFEGNGTRGDDIYCHPHFIKHLRYFVEGPRLPESVVTGLCQILNDQQGTSGTIMDQYRAFARKSVREHKVSPTELFRLAIELDMGIEAARTLREAAMSAK